MVALESPAVSKSGGNPYLAINGLASALLMTTQIEELRREADQIERVLTGVNDDESIRALREYAAELDAAIWRVRYNDK